MSGLFDDIIQHVDKKKRSGGYLAVISTNKSDGTREENDFYKTPEYAVQKLLDEEEFDGEIWECCCGDGAISDVLIVNKHSVYSTDLINRGYGNGRVNFLKSYRPTDNIITNPPFKDAAEIICQAQQVVRKKICMFLPTTYLEGSKRYALFTNPEFPFKCLHQFCGRVTLQAGDRVINNAGMLAFAWFVWERGYVGKPYINWIP